MGISDASHGLGSYGQSGYLCGIRITDNTSEDLFHMLDWASSKQQRVSFSSLGDEILAANDGIDRGHALCSGINDIFPKSISSLLGFV